MGLNPGGLEGLVVDLARRVEALERRGGDDVTIWRDAEGRERIRIGRDADGESLAVTLLDEAGSVVWTQAADA